MKKLDILKKESIIYNLKTLVLVCADILCINFASFLALFVRFEFNINELVASSFLSNVFMLAPVMTIATLGVFVFVVIV